MQTMHSTCTLDVIALKWHVLTTCYIVHNESELVHCEKKISTSCMLLFNCVHVLLTRLKGTKSGKKCAVNLLPAIPVYFYFSCVVKCQIKYIYLKLLTSDDKSHL